jgi:hypothetical protein
VSTFCEEITKEPSIVTLMRGNIKDIMTQEADKIITQKVTEFREELEKQKHLAIAGVLDALEVYSCDDIKHGAINLSLVYKPAVHSADDIARAYNKGGV